MSSNSAILPVVFMVLASVKVVACECKDSPVYYTVNSYNGIVLREAPSRESNVLARIFNKEIIEVCDPALNYGKAEGTEETWVKGCYKGKVGYVYKTFLQYSDKNIGFIIPGATHTGGAEKRNVYYGLYPDGERDGEQYFKVKKVALTGDTAKNEGEQQFLRIRAAGGLQPIFIVFGADITESTTPAMGRYFKNQRLADGEIIPVQLGKNYFYIFRNGTYYKAYDSTTLISVYEQKLDELKVRSVVYDIRGYENLIVSQKIETREVPQSHMVNLLWAGDLNGDNLLDLLVTSGEHYPCLTYRLFLSSFTKNGHLIKEAAKKDYCE